MEEEGEGSEGDQTLELWMFAIAVPKSGRLQKNEHPAFEIVDTPRKSSLSLGFPGESAGHFALQFLAGHLARKFRTERPCDIEATPELDPNAVDG